MVDVYRWRNGLLATNSASLRVGAAARSPSALRANPSPGSALLGRLLRHRVLDDRHRRRFRRQPAHAVRSHILKKINALQRLAHPRGRQWISRALKSSSGAGHTPNTRTARALTPSAARTPAEWCGGGYSAGGASKYISLMTRR